jgi:sterol 3beta-glucosyltransferase
MRVTIIAIGSRGDVQPYVALGRGLAAAGHDVRVATHAPFRELVCEHGLEFAAVAEGALSRGGETRSGRAWARHGSRLMPHWVGMLRDGASVARQRLADCWGATEGADAIVVSVLGTLPGLQMATARGLPMVRAYYAPRGRVARASVRQALWLCARPWVNRARRAALGLPSLGLGEPFGALDAARVPLLYGYSPLVAPADGPGEATGYWLLASAWEPDDELRTFLEAGDPPVLVTFGNLSDAAPERTTALLLDAIARAGCRALLIRGPHLAPGAELPPTALAIDPAPYDRLFPRVAAVVHHGGAGTTAYALHAGVPSVVVPRIADQPFWAGRVSALGVGPAPIPRRELSAERLAAAIHAATSDAGIRARAAALADGLAREDGVGAAVEAFDRLFGVAATPRPRCPLCGAAGTPRYAGLRDRLSAAPGVWRLVGCRCGALWLDPLPADLAAAYETYYTHGDGGPPPRARPFMRVLGRVRSAYLRGHRGAAALISVLPGVRDAFDDTAGHLPPPAPGARLLEIGFGRGDQLERMRDLGWSVTGVDVDPVAVGAARARGLDVREGDAASARFTEGAFDAVYMSHVIEHVVDPVALLRECRRILRPGGTLVAITPNVESRGHRVFGRAWFGLDPPRHLVLFSVAALRDAAARAGFEPELGTSARIAFITWIAGRDIRREGRVTSFDGAVPLGRLARGIAAQFAEAAALRFRPDAGEEIVLVARVPAAGRAADPEEVSWDAVPA